MKYILLLILLSVSSSVWAATFQVKTGFGYLTDTNGNIVAKTQYPIGDVNITDGYTYTEVIDQKSLDGINVHQPPISLTPQEQLDVLRKQTLDSLADTQLSSNPTVATLKQQGAN